jgi:hypothetical protein
MSPKKKQTPGKGKVPQTKVKTPKSFPFSKSQKKLYQKESADVQGKVQQVANIMLGLGNEILGRHIDDFAEELGIADDGFDYDVDPQKFRFVRRPKEDEEKE